MHSLMAHCCLTSKCFTWWTSCSPGIKYGQVASSSTTDGCKDKGFGFQRMFCLNKIVYLFICFCIIMFVIIALSPWLLRLCCCLRNSEVQWFDFTVPVNELPSQVVNTVQCLYRMYNVLYVYFSLALKISLHKIFSLVGWLSETALHKFLYVYCIFLLYSSMCIYR